MSPGTVPPSASLASPSARSSFADESLLLRGVVRGVRAGEVHELGRAKTEFMLPIERELLGVGLVREPDRGTEDDEEGEHS